MRKSIIISFLVVGLLLPMGCSKQYVVKTKEGTEYTSSKEPKFDKKTQTYQIKNEDGKNVTVNREDVQSVEER